MKVARFPKQGEGSDSVYKPNPHGARYFLAYSTDPLLLKFSGLLNARSHGSRSSSPLILFRLPIRVKHLSWIESTASGYPYKPLEPAHLSSGNDRAINSLILD